jgi:hypothetical protein
MPDTCESPALYSWDLVKMTSIEHLSIAPNDAYMVKNEKPN